MARRNNKRRRKDWFKPKSRVAHSFSWDDDDSSSSSSSVDQGSSLQQKIFRREYKEEGPELNGAVWGRGLPDDVYCTILAHLPLTSFYRLRTVCQSWSEMHSDKIFLDACARIAPKTPCLLMVDKGSSWMFEPALNDWISIPTAFFLPDDSNDPTQIVSSTGGRILALRHWHLLLHNPLTKTIKLLPQTLDMESPDNYLPTFFVVHILGMFVSKEGEDEVVKILVMNKVSNFDPDDDEESDDFDAAEPFISQLFDSQVQCEQNSWVMLDDIHARGKMSVTNATMVGENLRLLTRFETGKSTMRRDELSVYTCEPGTWRMENILLPHTRQSLVAPHLFNYKGNMLLVAAIPTEKTCRDTFPTWDHVILWQHSWCAKSYGPSSTGSWLKLMEISSAELKDDLWNTASSSFFFLAGVDSIYFGSRSGSSIGLIDLETKTWRLLPTFPGLIKYFGGAITKINFQPFLFEPKFHVMVN